MDYLQIYKKQYNSTWERVKLETIVKFKYVKNNNKNFDKIFENISTNLSQERRAVYAYFENNNLNSCFKLYDTRDSFVSKGLDPEEIVSLILNDEVKEEFFKLENEDYELFIKKLAIQQSIADIQFHFKNYKEYYELVCEQEKYENFFPKDFETIGFRDSKEFKEMYIKKHGVFKGASVQPRDKNKLNFDMNKEDEKYLAKINNFSKKEKFFLLAVLLDSVGSNNQNIEKENEVTYGNLPLPEYLRILAITKDIITLESFYKVSAKISLYTELKKKNKLVTKNESTLFLDDLNYKLKDLKIVKFQKFLYEFLKKN